MEITDILLVVFALITIPFGIISCIVPPLPGPVVSWAGLLSLYFFKVYDLIHLNTLIIFGVVVAIVSLADFFLPIYTTKKFGGTSSGIWGGVIGAVLGLFFPYGLILGPLLGAIIGDLIGGNTINSALKSGFGNFMGFVLSTLLKVGVCIAIGISIISNSLELIDWKTLF